jgi:hypothetical protein
MSTVHRISEWRVAAWTGSDITIRTWPYVGATITTDGAAYMTLESLRTLIELLHQVEATEAKRMAEMEERRTSGN